MFLSIWNLAGVSVIVLPRSFSNYKAIVNLYSPILYSRHHRNQCWFIVTTLPQGVPLSGEKTRRFFPPYTSFQNVVCMHEIPSFFSFHWVTNPLHNIANTCHNRAIIITAYHTIAIKTPWTSEEFLLVNHLGRLIIQLTGNGCAKRQSVCIFYSLRPGDAYFLWWRHQMKTCSVLLAVCAGNAPVPGEFPTQRPVTRSFDVLFDLRLNQRLSKQSRGWWFETLSPPLWRHRNVIDSSHLPPV